MPNTHDLPESEAYRGQLLDNVLSDITSPSKIELLCDKHNIVFLGEGTRRTAVEKEVPKSTEPLFTRLRKFDLKFYTDMKFASQYIIWYGSYNVKLRLLTLKHGTLAFLDMLIMPLLLPLLVTYYRWPSISYMDKNPQMSLNFLAKVGIASGCLALDFMLLWPITLLLFVTQVRWAPPGRLPLH